MLKSSPPWDSTKAQDWKAHINGFSEQATSELLAQSSARHRRLQLKCNQSHSKIALMSLFVPASAEARCVKCSIPCIADHKKEALHLPMCGHLIHTYCRRHCQQKCPRCQTGFENEAEAPSNGAEQSEWLHLEASYRMAQTEHPLEMLLDILARIDSAEFANSVGAFEVIWNARSILSGGGDTAVEKAKELQDLFSNQWSERLDSYRDRSEVVLGELFAKTNAVVNPVHKVDATKSFIPSPQSMVKPNVTAQVPVPGLPNNGVGAPKMDRPTKGNFMSKSGKTKFFTMLTKYNNRPCPKCNRIYEIGSDYICKSTSEEYAKWYCVFCASGFTNGEVPAQIAKYDAGGHQDEGRPSKRQRGNNYRSSADEKASVQTILDQFKL